jgi:2-haloacid dehalogenase
MIDFGRYKVLTFDVYGTLIDWETGLLRALEPWRDRAGVSASDSELMQTYAGIEAQIMREAPGTLYPKVLETALKRMAEQYGADATAAETEAFGRSIGDWPPFRDTPDALRYLAQHYRLVVLSNVDKASFRRSAERMGVTFHRALTAEEIGSYKPSLRNFEYALAELGKEGYGKDDILHVAQSLFHDHVPAAQIGLTSVWINRQGARPGGLTPRPEGEARPAMEFPDLASFAEAHRQAAGGAGPG